MTASLSLLVQQLHDIVESLLADKIFRIDDFAWFRVCKVQWDPESMSCIIRHGFATLRYGWE